MKKYILAVVLLVVLLPALALAAPFLRCNPQAGVVSYTITGDAFFTTPEPAEADGSIVVDLAGIPVGAHSITVSACTLWGCVPITTPFAFTKVLPVAPAGLRITAN